MSEKVELKKNLSLFNCVSLIIGIIIGSGIFLSPQGVIKEVGSVGSSLIIWVGCGVFSIFGAISYMELGCMMPRAGGEYEYLINAFGDFPAFLFIWTFVIIMIPASFALTALTFADYTLKIFFVECSPPYTSRLLLAAAAIIFVTVINCVSLKWVNYTQNAYNIGKIAGLFLIIGFGIYCLFIGRYEYLKDPFEGSSSNIGNYAVAFHSGLYSYSGWSYLNYVVEEIKDVNRTFPISIAVGLTIVIIIYFFSNVAYFTLLSPREMITSDAVAFTFTSKLIGPFSWIMSVFVALSSLGYINGALFSASRTIFGAARNSHMPTVLALINIKFLTPITSILFMALLSLICIFIEDVFLLINMTMLSEYIFIGSTIAGLLWLRKVRPDASRPIKVNLFFPVVFLLACLFILIMTFIKMPKESILCLVIIMSGAPVYLIFVKSKKPKSLQKKINDFTVWIQKFTLSVFDESKVE